MKKMETNEDFPLNSYEELLTFVKGTTQRDIDIIVPRSTSFSFVPLEKNSFALQKFPSKQTPKTLLCHDMKGGYLEDRFINGCYSMPEEPYRFIHWSQIDTFVYFSHHFITIPPRPWIRAAHKNGVVILGTIITEFENGEKLCSQILKDEETVDEFVENCVRLAVLLGFDGWLVNIENKLKDKQISLMTKLLKDLRARMRKLNESSQVIWYDAVTIDGELDWQNELNAKNQIFFQNSDGIFLNYTWKSENLVNSVKNLSGRPHFDVYVGVDVFGRGCIGGGGFGCQEALQLIRQKNLSVAIFAPGWTHECCRDTESYPYREYKFWHLLQPYLFTKGPIVDSENPIFETNFCPGVGETCSYWWMNYSSQHFQPSLLAPPLTEDTELTLYPFSVFNEVDFLRTPPQISHHIVLQRLHPKTSWKLDAFDDVFPIIVSQIEGKQCGRSIEFVMRCANTDVELKLCIRVSSNKSLRHLEVNPKTHVVDDEDNVHSFSFEYKTETNDDVIDFVGIKAEQDHFRLKSFAVRVQ